MKRFPSVDAVLVELDSALQRVDDLDTITFSGSGEPTLHPHFEELVAGVIRLRDRHSPRAKVTVLSNGALANRPSIRSGLLRADLRLMKLDAGDEITFQAINRARAFHPHPADCRKNLRALDDVIIQTMLLDGGRLQRRTFGAVGLHCSSAGDQAQVGSALQHQPRRTGNRHPSHTSRHAANDRARHRIAGAGLSRCVLTLRHWPRIDISRQPYYNEFILSQ